MSDPKAINREVADFAVRDPYARPHHPIEQEDFTPAALEALERLALPLEGKRIVMTTRASKPRGCIDATASTFCVACGFAVWVSPSSREVLAAPDGVALCNDCFDPMLALTPERKAEWLGDFARALVGGARR